jgi:phosphatidylglycerol---prolipoprotein diacylglyceryl transferase
MLPYIQLGPLQVGSHTLYPFGILITTGILVGILVMVWRAPKVGLDRQTAFRFAAVNVISGLAGAHVLKVLFFEPAAFLQNPAILFDFKQGGIYSFGGLFGGLAGGWLYLHFSKAGASRKWEYFDLIVFAFPFAWLFGRAGCAVVHDHPGIRAYNWLSVDFPGGPRYDLGLLEFLYIFLMIGLFLYLDQRPRPGGFFLMVGLLVYGPFRFLLDSLHEPGVPRFILTPDQAWGLFATIAGLVVLAKIRTRLTHDHSSRP